MTRTLVRCLLGLSLFGCPFGCAAPAEPTEAPATTGGTEPVASTTTRDPLIYPVELEEGLLVVPRVAAEAAALTLVGPGGACIARAKGEAERMVATGCPADPPPWVAFGGESPATVTLAERVEAPSVEAGAAYVGRFGTTGFGFEMKSPPGDGLCPGAPTTITFLHGDPDAVASGRVLGSMTIEAPITRSGSEGVMGLVRVDGLLVAVVVWGGDRRTVATLEGDVLLDTRVSGGEPCDCCDE